MLRNHQFRDLPGDYSDEGLDWLEQYTQEHDFSVPPSSFQDMSSQAYNGGTLHPFGRPLKPAPREPYPQQYSQLRDHSLIDAPNGWTDNISARSSLYGYPFPPQHGQGSPCLPPSLNIQTPWSSSGPIHELDASSTISPLSPKTPGGHSDIDVNIASNIPPWISGPSSSAPYHQSQFPDNLMGSSQQLKGINLRDIQAHPDECSDVLGSTGTMMDYQSKLLDDLECIGQNYNEDLPEIKEEGIRTPRMSVHMTESSPQIDDDDEAVTDAQGDEDEYHPSGKISQTPILPELHQTIKTSTRQHSKRSPGPMKAVPYTYRIVKPNHSRTSSLPSDSHALEPSTKTCPNCTHHFTSQSTLNKHIQTCHTRPYACIFARYGCQQTFGSKNEWTRHIRVQHLRLEAWRCDMGKCRSSGAGSSSGGGDGAHLFDRKDLFTQHVRRMHPSFLPSGKKTKANANANANNTNHGRFSGAGQEHPGRDGAHKFHNDETAIQTRCHLRIRQPPPHSTCPYCPLEFDNWDARLEHVGKHLDSGDHDGLVESEDLVLRQWLETERLLRWTGEQTDGGWKIVGVSGKKTHGKAAPGGRGRGRAGERMGRRPSDREEDEDAEGETEDEI